MSKQKAKIEIEKPFQKLLKSILEDDPDLTDEQVEQAQEAVNLLHKRINFHRRSWKVDSMGGGNLWTVSKNDADKRFEDYKKQNKFVALIEIHRGEEKVLNEHQPKKTK